LTNYLVFDEYGQPTGIDVKFTFMDITTEEKELIERLQELYNSRMKVNEETG